MEIELYYQGRFQKEEEENGVRAEGPISVVLRRRRGGVVSGSLYSPQGLQDCPRINLSTGFDLSFIFLFPFRIQTNNIAFAEIMKRN